MAYVILIENAIEDEPDFYIKIKTFDNPDGLDVRSPEYVQDKNQATKFEKLSELEETIEYCHISGYEIEKVK